MTRMMKTLIDGGSGQAGAMESLPDGYRVIFSLYLLEGYDHSEISQILGISESTSKTQYMKAKRKMKELLIRTEMKDRLEEFIKENRRVSMFMNPETNIWKGIQKRRTDRISGESHS